MARGHPADVGNRGGERIQTSGQTRTRLALSLGSLLAAAGLAAPPVVATSGIERLVGLGGALALPALAVGLATGAAPALAWALAALGGEYAAWFALQGGAVDTRSPLYGVGLLLVGELAFWALDRRSAAHPDRELDLRRGVFLLVALTASIAVGAAILAASAAPLGGGVALEAVGVAAAVGLLGIVAALARSRVAREPDGL